MTQAARIVLQDVKHAIANHTTALQSEEFRVSWFAIVGLLRSIGHVLDKVDTESSPAMRQAVKQQWARLLASKPEPAIFWGFIEAERNRFLKNYEHGIKRTLTSRWDTARIVTVIDVGNSRGGVLSNGTEVQSEITDGPFKGEHEKKIAWLAYDWWQEYLNEVDRLARSHAGA